MATLSKSKMAKLFHRWATGYSAGIDLRRLLKREAKSGSAADRLRNKTMSAAINEGATLAQAMQKADCFPELAIAVVKAGEAGGRLDDSFGRLSRHYESLVKFRKNFLASISWPLFELGFSILLVGLLIIVLGWVSEIAGGEPVDLFGLGWSPMAYFIAYWVIMFMIFGSIFLLIYGAIKGWFGTLPMRIARRIPLIGKTVECLALSRFAWTMSVADNAGMDAVETVQLAARSTENYYYLETEEQMAKFVQNGKPYYDAIKATGAYPDDLLTHVDTGEMTGQLAESMLRASEEYQDTAERNMMMIGKIGFFLTLMFVGILIGGTVIFLYKKLYFDRLQEFMTISFIVALAKVALAMLR